jgi:hypothetical protein
VAIFFSKSKSIWFNTHYPLSEIRSVNCIKIIPAETIWIPGSNHNLAGTMNNIGGAIGAEIANAMAKKKAQQDSGLRFDIRDTNRPEFFTSIPDEQLRNRVYEAARQIAEGYKPNCPVIHIPPKIREALRKPTEQELKARAEKQAQDLISAQRNEVRLKKLRHGVIALGVLCLALLGVYTGYHSYARYPYLDDLAVPGKVTNATGFSCITYRFGLDYLRDTYGLVPTHRVAKDFTLDVPATVGFDQTTLSFTEGDFVFERQGHTVKWRSDTTAQPEAIVPLGKKGFPPRIALKLPAQYRSFIAPLETPTCNQFGQKVR